ncbi:MAG: SecY-interacting protein Syd [Gammaproteobacteria bacterium]|nr:MAG: SecY-interacting protein Syd [Gammaproteobacteria bacterium]
MRADHPVVVALDALVDRCLQKAGGLLVRHDHAWPSPCERGQPDGDGYIRWEPVPRDDYSTLAGLENALEEPVHEDLKAFYGRYWSHTLATEAPQGQVDLIGVWNPDDAVRLNENLLGHILQQRRFFGLRRRLPMTLFFATTDADSEYVLSLDNHSGEVIVERPGTRDWRVVAPGLASFLVSLVPR